MAILPDAMNAGAAERHFLRLLSRELRFQPRQFATDDCRGRYIFVFHAQESPPHTFFRHMRCLCPEMLPEERLPKTLRFQMPPFS